MTDLLTRQDGATRQANPDRWYVRDEDEWDRLDAAVRRLEFAIVLGAALGFLVASLVRAL